MALSGTVSRNYHNNAFTLKIDWSAVQDIDANTSTITATLKVVSNVSGATLYVSGKSNTSITIDGVSYTFTSAAVSHSGVKTTILGTATRTISHDSSGYKTFTISGNWPLVATIGGTYYASWSCSGSGTLDKITQTPNAPTSISVQRISDTSHKVTWVHTATGLRPVSTFRLQRWDISTGSYSTIATLSGTTKEYTDKSTVANRLYYYRVRAENSVGVSSYKGSSAVKTTPAAPSQVVASQQGDNLKLTWKNNHPTRTGYTYVTGNRIEVSKNGGSYTFLKNVGASDTSYTYQDPGGGYYTFRIRAYTESLNSSYVVSNEIRLAFLPSEPSNFSLIRYSDNQIKLNWQNNPTAEKPYDKIEIQRWDNVTGNWYGLTEVNGDIQSFTDLTTQSNRSYNYRIRAKNTVGVSDYVESGVVHNTPAKPENLSVARQELNIRITWVNMATNAEQIRLQRRTEEDGEWGEYADVTILSPEKTDYTDIEPGGGVHQYRIRAEQSGLYSEWEESAVVMTLQPPNAPSNLYPDGVTVEQQTEIKFTWNYNSTDGTDQTAFELRYKTKSAASWTTITRTTNVKSHTFPAEAFLNEEEYVWQVRTKGEHADYSEWSAAASFITARKPSIIITFPLETYDFPNLTAAWLYSDVGGHEQTFYRVRLYEEDAEVYNFLGYGDDENHALDYHLENNKTYKLSIQVGNSVNLLSDPKEITFTVSYAIPDRAELELEFVKEEGKVIINIINPEEKEPYAAFNRIYRRINNGKAVLIADNLPPNTSFIDYLPITAGKNSYFVVTISDLPSMNTSFEYDLEIKARGYYYLNSGSKWEQVMSFKYGPELTIERSRPTSFYQFEGRELPVMYQGVTLTHTLNLSFYVDLEDLDRLRNVVYGGGNLYYRDHFGRRFKCGLVSPIRLTKIDGETFEFAATIMEIE